MITDKIDGDLARKHNLITDFGKIADPIADKALTGMAFVGLSIIGELWWWVTIVVLVREWGITFMRFWLIKHDVIVPAGQGGKLKTTVQALALTLLIAPLKQLDGRLGDHRHGRLVDRCRLDGRGRGVHRGDRLPATSCRCSGRRARGQGRQGAV